MGFHSTYPLIRIYFKYDGFLQMNHRFEEKYHVLKANTERMRNSTVPYIQRLLNTKEQERKKAAPSL